MLLLDALQDLGLLLDEGVRSVEEAAVVERQEPGVVLFEPGKTSPVRVGMSLGSGSKARAEFLALSK